MTDRLSYDGLVALFETTAGYFGIALRIPAKDAFDAAAEELLFPWTLDDAQRAEVDRGRLIPGEYADHNYVLRALGTHAKRALLDVPATGRCWACNRLKIPGYYQCHWHGAKNIHEGRTDDVLLATMRETVGG